MRDKNLNQEQFNIQLERKMFQCKLTDDRFLRSPVFVTPTRCIDPEWIGISYPRDFRLIRALVISHWYFPEKLFWRIHLDLQDFSFSQLNKKQRLEINLLLSSKENMEKYLYRTERYSASEIFGNILGNDLKDLEKCLKFRRRKFGPVREPIRRRGYKDKGTRKPSHRWLPDSDFSLTEKQIELEKELLNQHKLVKRILSILENN